jgi:hypothetical protein
MMLNEHKFLLNKDHLKQQRVPYYMLQSLETPRKKENLSLLVEKQRWVQSADSLADGQFQ